MRSSNLHLRSIVREQFRSALLPIKPPTTEEQPSIEVRVVQYLLYMNEFAEYITTARDRFLIVSMSEEKLNYLIRAINGGTEYNLSELKITDNVKFEECRPYMLADTMNYDEETALRHQYQQLIDNGEIDNYITFAMVIITGDTMAATPGYGSLSTMIVPGVSSYNELLDCCQLDHSTMRVLLEQPVETMLPPKYKCNLCAMDKSDKTCGGCHVTYYCSKECQRNDWRRHRAQCFGHRFLIAAIHFNPK